MKFLSLDIETTGLNPDICQIIEVGAVLVDTDKPESEWPTFQRLVKHDHVRGELYAIKMNLDLITEAQKTGVSLDEMYESLLRWVLQYVIPEVRDQQPSGARLGDTIKFSIAGKNLNFDLSFLRKHAGWAGIAQHINHRFIDAGNLYWDPIADGPNLPSSADVMKRARIPGEVAHTALADALVVGYVVTNYVFACQNLNNLDSLSGIDTTYHNKPQVLKSNQAIGDALDTPPWTETLPPASSYAEAFERAEQKAIAKLKSEQPEQPEQLPCPPIEMLPAELQPFDRPENHF